jgi:hypothetical protein
MERVVEEREPADLLTFGILLVSSSLFGWLLIRQGIHKRDVIQAFPSLLN